MRNNENYPRSKGLFLSLPQRQTMVLSTESTIRELCSRTTPTSQFSSLHFIASTAIGAKSIETARALHSCFFVWITVATTLAALARVLAHTGKVAAPRGLYTYGRVGGAYLTGAGGATAASSPRAAVGGDRARTSPVTSLLCYGDLTPQKLLLMRHANLHSLTTRQGNSYWSIMIYVALRKRTLSHFSFKLKSSERAALLYASRGLTENRWTSADVGPSVLHSYITNSTVCSRQSNTHCICNTRSNILRLCLHCNIDL